MKAIISVLGKDRIGIIARVCTYLSEKQINVCDISQNIVQGYFNMMMIVDLSRSVETFEQTLAGLEKLGKEMGMDIRLQHEDIFNSMHRI
jgi:ACT domain-containing protein